MCGVFGVFGHGLEAARLVHSGLWALQHRGQESSGIASTDGTALRVYKKEGLVAHVYDEEHLELLAGFGAIGHNRYSTSGGSFLAHAQPTFSEDKLLALGHNGNLPTTEKLAKFLTGKGIDITGLNDSAMMHRALEYYVKQGKTIEQAVRNCYPLFTGVFSLVILTPDKMVAVRDACGIRPLAVGQLNGGFIFSSETCALDTIGAKYIKDLAPGQMAVVGKSGIKFHTVKKGTQKLDIFEFVYFARPDSMLLGKSVNEVRKNLGRALARENNIKADVVIPVPDSAIPAAIGFSEVSGIPFDHGLIKNRYIHRTFIRPAQKLRERDVAVKLNPLAEVISGKNVVVVDDSIVRGTTSKKLVQLLKDEGAKKIHFMVSSPPIKFPDFYGIDLPNQDELIGSRKPVAAIAKYMGATSLNYLSYKGMIDATGLPESVFSTHCFSGIYPIDPGKVVKYHSRSRSSVG